MDKLLFDTIWASYGREGELEKILIREDWYDRLDYLWNGGEHRAATFSDFSGDSTSDMWADLELGVDADVDSIVFMVMMVKAAANHGLSIGKWRKELHTVNPSDDEICVVSRPVELSG